VNMSDVRQVVCASAIIVMTSLFQACAQTPVTRPTAAPPAAAKLEPLHYELGYEHLHVQVVDLSPRFLAFYAAAKDEPDPDRRFDIWREHYGFAAVPPGPRGEAMARELLDSGWPKYPLALPLVRAGARAMEPDPLSTLRKVADVLKLDRPIRVRVVAYVGAFDDNAFSYGDNGQPVVAMPLEMTRERRELVFIHEMTHAVHIILGGLTGEWERSIAATALQEGLAMHVTREAVPGREMRDYLDAAPDWLDQAQARERAILEGALPYLEARDGETVFRFTFGGGTTGLPREAYYVGWLVVEKLRANGRDLAEIARIPEADIPRVAASTIREILREDR
jgi:hypothetical protein